MRNDKWDPAGSGGAQSRPQHPRAEFPCSHFVPGDQPQADTVHSDRGKKRRPCSAGLAGASPGDSSEPSQSATQRPKTARVGPCLGKGHAGGCWVLLCSAPYGWLGTSSSRDAACPSDSKNKLLLLSQNSRPFPQSLLVVPRGRDLASGNRSAFV